VVVNATGVWADRVAAGVPSIRPAKGVHLTLPADRVATDVALVVTAPGDGRSIFVVPWPGTAGRVYVGTTDTDYDGPLDDPLCTADDVAYLLDAVNGALTTDLSAADVVGTWAGLRPLVAGAPGGRSADLSRRHRVTTGADGVVTVTGGKLTTYRKMAADTVDVVLDVLGRRRPASPTRRLPIHGSRGHDSLDGIGVGLPSADVAHLAPRYGGEARVVAAMVAADPELGQPLVPTLPYLRAEAVFGARYEMARSVDDILSRRTRCSILARDASADAAVDVARLLARELGWSDAVTMAQAEAYRSRAAAEREAAGLATVRR
jgi:glycerol-3-phosphate dehydrogenase